MAAMTAQVRTVLDKQDIVILATSSRSGVPNAVPVGAKKIIDNETILISDQFFGKTLTNMNENPVAGFAPWNEFNIGFVGLQGAYQKQNLLSY